eukprot:scaffold21309_cov46-Prasinocladus_malaysianus.AAC.4
MQEIRGLFDRAMAGSHDSQHLSRDPQRRGPTSATPAVFGKAKMSPGDFDPGQGELEGDDLDGELAATEARALRLAMQKEGRRLQVEANQKLEIFEKELQVLSYAESYDLTLLELRKEYQVL